MFTLIQVPQYGPLLKMYASHPTVTDWLKADGEAVEKGEIVVVVETSKATVELEAPASGLVFILKKVKEKVKIGDTLGVVVDTQEEFEEYRSSLSKQLKAEA